MAWKEGVREIRQNFWKQDSVTSHVHGFHRGSLAVPKTVLFFSWLRPGLRFSAPLAVGWRGDWRKYVCLPTPTSVCPGSAGCPRLADFRSQVLMVPLSWVPEWLERSLPLHSPNVHWWERSKLVWCYPLIFWNVCVIVTLLRVTKTNAETVPMIEKYRTI